MTFDSLEGQSCQGDDKHSMYTPRVYRNEVAFRIYATADIPATLLFFFLLLKSQPLSPPPAISLSPILCFPFFVHV